MNLDGNVENSRKLKVILISCFSSYCFFFVTFRCLSECSLAVGNAFKKTHNCMINNEFLEHHNTTKILHGKT